MENTNSPLGIILLLAAIWVVIVPLGLWLLMGFLRRTVSVKAAVALVESNPEAMALLGAPLTVGRFIWGRINVSLISVLSLIARHRAGSGSASLSIPLQGSRGQARLKARLEKVDGEWRPYYGRLMIGSKEMMLVDERAQGGWFKRIFG